MRDLITIGKTLYLLNIISQGINMVWLVSLWSDSNSVGHILLVYAIVITVGLLLGRIKIFGISLGVTFVLFAGLAAGYFGFTVNTTVMHFLRDFGLILFVFFIGLQVGPSFFSSFRSGGIQLNLLTLLAVFLSLAVTVGLYFAFSDTVSLPQMLGVYFGAVTNTPGLGATQEALNMLDYKGEDIAVAYACAYPLAVVAIIATSICLRFIFRIDLKEEDRMWEEAEKENNEAPIFFHVKVTNAALEGKQLEQLRNFIDRPFICSRLLHKGTIISPHAKDTVHVGDVMRIVASAENKDAITVFCGSEDKDVDLATESSPITARNIRVTRSAMNGLTVHDLHLSRYDGVNITRIFRAGMTLFPYPHLRFQIGDVVYCVGPERSIRRLADKLGNQEKKLDHPNLISIFLGIAVGILFGSLPIAIPGMPVPLKLGLAGGPLVVAILIGRFGHKLHLVTYTTMSANLMLREIGIVLFLASVGIDAGANFVQTVVEGDGLLYVGCGFLITVIPLLIIGAIARLYYKVNYFTLMGLIAGSNTDPPALAYANQVTSSDAPAVGYSTVYPLSMFLRILTGQMILLAMM